MRTAFMLLGNGIRHHLFRLQRCLSLNWSFPTNPRRPLHPIGPIPDNMRANSPIGTLNLVRITNSPLRPLAREWRTNRPRFPHPPLPP